MDDETLIAIISQGIVDGTDLDTTAEAQAREVLRQLRAAGVIVGAVRPLEWVWMGASWSAQSIVGQYHIAKTDNPRNDRYRVTLFYLSHNGNKQSHGVGFIDGEKAAKAVAQADCEDRIRSIVEAPQ